MKSLLHLFHRGATYLTRAINPVNPACPMESFYPIPSGSKKEAKDRIQTTTDLTREISKKEYALF
jgi:hypothetical protein